MQEAKPAQFHHSYFRMCSRLKRLLVTNGVLADAGCVVVVSLALAPLLMVCATSVERRLGPSAGGWVAALPIGFAIAVIAVTLDAGGRAASTMALSAATHVPAQVCFAVVFAAILARHGLLLGAASGAVAYLAASLLLATLATSLAVALAIPSLILAPRLITANRPKPASPRRWSATAMTCAAASVVVGLAVATSRLAGPETAGAVAAFPTVTTTLAVAVVARDGWRAGAHVCAGLARSLPCYLTFCLVIVAAEPRTGLLATGIALLACVIAGRVTWRFVPVASSTAPAR
jgi:hypothetical protein